MPWPNTLSAICLLRFVLSQTEKLPRLHCSHSPQMIVNGTTTRSPFRKLPFMPEPTSTTSPIISWPIMSPGSIAGMRLWKRWRSEPQMAQLVTLTMASRGSWISGSETVSHLMSSFPCQTSAFINDPLRQPNDLRTAAEDGGSRLPYIPA